jgi:hypothetical protein
VDADGAENRARQAGVEVLARELLALELALLVDIERAEGRRFIGGRPDIAVYTDGTAMDDAADTFASAGVEHMLGPADIDLSVDFVREARFTVDGADVVHDFTTLHGTADIRGIHKVTDDWLDTIAAQRFALGRIAHQSTHLIATNLQGASEVPSGKAACSCY